MDLKTRLHNPKSIVSLLLLAIAIVYFASQFDTPFRDHDPLIYTLVGRGIYHYGVMPYDYVFDHKPLLTYYLFGLISEIDIRFYPYQWLSMLCYGLAAVFVHRFCIRGNVSLPVAFFLIVTATAGTLSFSGNTEIIFVPLELAALYFAIRASAGRFHLALAALLTSAAFSVNYISGVALFPALLLALYLGSSSFRSYLLTLLAFGALCLLFLAGLLATIPLFGGDLQNYVSLQRGFLKGYSEMREVPTPRFLVELLGFLVLCLLALPAAINRTDPVRRNFSRVLLLLALSPAASFAASAKFYPHYLFMVSVPAMVIVANLNFEKGFSRLVIVCIAAVLAVFSTFKLGTMLRNGLPDTEASFRPYAEIGALVGDEKLMSMRSSIVPLYFSKAYPFQPLVWDDHAAIIYGAGEDDYYLSQIEKKPVYVLTGKAWCEAAGSASKSCAAVLAGYDNILSYGGNGQTFPGYDLYKLKQGS